MAVALLLKLIVKLIVQFFMSAFFNINFWECRAVFAANRYRAREYFWNISSMFRFVYT